MEMTKELEQALTAVCDLALKHGGLVALNAVNVIVASTQPKASTEAPATE